MHARNSREQNQDVAATMVRDAACWRTCTCKQPCTGWGRAIRGHQGLVRSLAAAAPLPVIPSTRRRTPPRYLDAEPRLRQLAQQEEHHLSACAEQVRCDDKRGIPVHHALASPTCAVTCTVGRSCLHFHWEWRFGSAIGVELGRAGCGDTHQRSGQLWLMLGILGRRRNRRWLIH